jgi:hypothetical protein
VFCPFVVYGTPHPHFSLSQVSRRSEKPVWNETLEVPAINPESFVDVLLKQVQALRSIIVGRARIPLNEIAAAGESGHSKTLILYGESLDMKRENNGELEVLIRWVFDAETELLAERVRNPKVSLAERFGRLFRPKRKSVETEGNSDKAASSIVKKDGFSSRTKEEHYSIKNKALPNNDMTPSEIQLYVEEQRERRFEEADELLKAEEEEMLMSMKEGDYTIMVSSPLHILHV